MSASGMLGVLGALRRRQPTLWHNLGRQPDIATEDSLPLSRADLDNALEMWAWLRPLFAHRFEEAQNPPWGEPGTISSPLKQADGLGEALGLKPGRCLMKMDSHLAVCGSVKARGGMFEVLNLAARIGEKAKFAGDSNSTGADSSGEDTTEHGGDANHGLFSPEKSCTPSDGSVFSSTELLTDPACAEALARFNVVVGSTGNLGLSVGLSAAALGMHSTVHMSVDAKQWKKDLLRERGATVVEHAGLIGDAYAAGRAACAKDKFAHFVDDESSKVLKLGYACAAFELKQQLEDLNIRIDDDNPLVVHIPCGVGGAPGGICWGLEHAFGDNAENVHTFFAEPVAAPCCTLALAGGEVVPVAEIGLDGKTEADGLAVGKASEIVVRLVEHVVAGAYTVEDAELFEHLRTLVETEGPEMFIEPSCCAGLAGPQRMREYVKDGMAGKNRISARSGGLEFGLMQALVDGTHVFWATGGSLVPEDQRKELLGKFL